MFANWVLAWLVVCLVGALLSGCSPKERRRQVNPPKIPEMVKEIVKLSDGKWASGVESMHVLARPLNPESWKIARERIDHVESLNNNQSLKIEHPIVLGETDAPHLYQFLDIALGYRPVGEILADAVLIRVALVISSRDADGGINDFNDLLPLNRHWELGTEYRFNLKRMPLSIFERTVALDGRPHFRLDILATLKTFFDKYVHEDFRIIGLRVIHCRKMFYLYEPDITREGPAILEGGAPTEYHFYIPTN